MQNDTTKQQEKKELVHRGLTIDYKHIPLSILDMKCWSHGRQSHDCGITALGRRWMGKLQLCHSARPATSRPPASRTLLSNHLSVHINTATAAPQKKNEKENRKDVAVTNGLMLTALCTTTKLLYIKPVLVQRLVCNQSQKPTQPPTLSGM